MKTENSNKCFKLLKKFKVITSIIFMIIACLCVMNSYRAKVLMDKIGHTDSSIVIEMNIELSVAIACIIAAIASISAIFIKIKNRTARFVLTILSIIAGLLLLSFSVLILVSGTQFIAATYLEFGL